MRAISCAILLIGAGLIAMTESYRLTDETFARAKAGADDPAQEQQRGGDDCARRAVGKLQKAAHPVSHRSHRRAAAPQTAPCRTLPRIIEGLSQ